MNQDISNGISEHPAFRNVGLVVPLSGFSGAHVAVIGADSPATKRVRKAAIDQKDSSKLQDQANRQAHLAAALMGAANVPAVIEEGEINNCYWYDMEYVPGRDAIDYLSTGTKQKVKNIVEQIFRMLQVQSELSSENENCIDLHSNLIRKLNEIASSTDGAFDCHLDKIRKALSNRTTFLKPNYAHGDLTLENILIDRYDRMWLIDPIASPFDHYWIDLAKLFQDLLGRWFIHRGRSLSIGLTRTVSDQLLRQAIKLDARYETYHSVLLALTFARILPYCKSTENITFVTGRIDLSLKLSANY